MEKIAKEWKDRLFEAEKRIMGKAIAIPGDAELLKKKQEISTIYFIAYNESLKRFHEASPLKYTARFETFDDDVIELVESIQASNNLTPPQMEEIIQEFIDSDTYHLESFQSLLSTSYIPEKDIKTERLQYRLAFLSIYYNAFIPFLLGGNVLPGVDGRLSFNLGQLGLMTITFIKGLTEYGRKEDRIKDGKQSLAAKRAELKRAVFYAYKTLRGKDENKKLRKKVDFVRKIEREVNGPGYFAKLKKPPSSRSIVRLLDELTAEGRIHPPWKRSQT